MIDPLLEANPAAGGSAVLSATGCRLTIPVGNLVLVLAAAVAIHLGGAMQVFGTSAAVSFDTIVTAWASGPWPGVAVLVGLIFSLVGSFSADRV